MLFETPGLEAIEEEVLSEIEDLKKALRQYTYEPRRWVSALRQSLAAKHVQGSNSIEGFKASLDDAAAIDLGEEPIDADEETKLAIKGYCEAMTFVLQLASDEEFVYTNILLKSLHFMMTSYDLKNRPGQWRAGSIYVQDEATGENVYEGPPLESVPGLMDELIQFLQPRDDSPPMVRAAMAHLNLVMIHPFRDGNGRMARCLQTLTLAREGVLFPEFISVEEYLGRNTRAYYDVLAQVGQGSWHPQNDTRPWIRFILLAHVRQARAVLRRIRESERLWVEIDKLAQQRAIPERAITVLWDAAMGYRIRRSVYIAKGAEAGEEITEQTATRDLSRLSELGLLVPQGERRGRFYVASDELRAIRAQIVAARDARDNSDPFQKSA